MKSFIKILLGISLLGAVAYADGFNVLPYQGAYTLIMGTGIVPTVANLKTLPFLVNRVVLNIPSPLDSASPEIPTILSNLLAYNPSIQVYLQPDVETAYLVDAWVNWSGYKNYPNITACLAVDKDPLPNDPTHNCDPSPPPPYLPPTPQELQECNVNSVQKSICYVAALQGSSEIVRGIAYDHEAFALGDDPAQVKKMLPSSLQLAWYVQNYDASFAGDIDLYLVEVYDLDIKHNDGLYCYADGVAPSSNDNVYKNCQQLKDTLFPGNLVGENIAPTIDECALQFKNNPTWAQQNCDSTFYNSSMFPSGNNTTPAEVAMASYEFLFNTDETLQNVPTPDKRIPNEALTTVYNNFQPSNTVFLFSTQYAGTYGQQISATLPISGECIRAAYDKSDKFGECGLENGLFDWDYENFSNFAGGFVKLFCPSCTIDQSSQNAGIYSYDYIPVSWLKAAAKENTK